MTQNGRCRQHAELGLSAGVATGEVVQGAGAVVTEPTSSPAWAGSSWTSAPRHSCARSAVSTHRSSARKEELARLSTGARRRSAGRSLSRCRPSSAEPGIGKTRLARELALREEARTTVLVARCIAQGQGVTFLPLLEVLRRAVPERALGAELDVGTRVARLSALAEGAESAPLGESVAGPSAGYSRRWRATQPVLLVLDDIHWAEPGARRPGRLPLRSHRRAAARAVPRTARAGATAR